MFCPNHKFFLRRFRVVQIGAGASGRLMLAHLAQIHAGLQVFDHPGFNLTLIDGDRVSEANVIRGFHPSFVGQFKATVLIHQVNAHYGFDWQDVPEFYRSPKAPKGHRGNLLSNTDLVISCVDTPKARRAVGRSLESRSLWLDLGNEADYGQFILGGQGLPTILDRHPELKTAKSAQGPSCSAREALFHQDLSIHPLLTSAASNLLWQLLRYGKLDFVGGYVNLKSGVTTPINF